MMDIQKQKLIIEGAVTYSRLFDALKGMYEVDDDDSVWEIFNQADDQLEEVVNALKLLSAPPAPVKLPDALTAEDVRWMLKQSDHNDGPKCRIEHAECIGAKMWNTCRAEVLRLNKGSVEE